MLHFSNISDKRSQSPGTNFELRLEQLEDRTMLSTVEIFAAGATGQENLDLFINDQYVTTFFNVGGDVDQRDFVRFTYESDQPLTPSNIGVAFGNDAFDPATGFDRNLLVDRIVVDGVTAETEDPSTFSTGIYRNGLTGPGFFETELFNVNAIFTYADPASGDRIEFDAQGSTGEEIVELVIDDEVVQSFGFNRAGVTETFSFVSGDSDLNIGDIRIQFVNDLFDPATGFDRNAQIFEYRLTDSETGSTSVARTTDSDVLSSGIFVPDVGITSGLGAGGFLAGNGFVETVVDDSSGSSLAFDDSFEAFDFLVDLLAVGPNDQIAGLAQFSSELVLVDSSGQLVTSFGDNGRLILDPIFESLSGIPSPDFVYTDIEFFSDGSILVTGSGEPFFSFGDNTPLILKINPDGTLDSSFTQQGVLQGTFTQLPASDEIVQTAIDQDGRILILSTNRPTAISPQNVIVARLNPDGSLDTSFGNGGNVFIPIANLTGDNGVTLPLDVLIDSNNQAVIVALRFGGLDSPIGVTRLNENGTIDAGFGNGGFFQTTGVVLTQFDGTNTPIRVRLDSQDRIVVSSDSFDDGDFITFSQPSLVRATADGQLDTSFGDNGRLILVPDLSIADAGVSVPAQFGGLSLSGDGLAIDADDNVFVVSTFQSGLFVIQSVLASGQIDSSFGISGTQVVDSSADAPDNITNIEFSIFDSNNNLVVGGNGFLSTDNGIDRLTFV